DGLVTLLPQLLAQPGQGDTHPPFLSHRVARDVVRQEALKGGGDSWLLRLDTRPASGKGSLAASFLVDTSDSSLMEVAEDVRYSRGGAPQAPRERRGERALGARRQARAPPQGERPG